MRLAALVLVVAIAGCGGGDPEPPSGTFDADGHAMVIECKGEGTPTVVLDSGLGVDSTSSWAAVRPQVAKHTRVCLYDRAGMASSEPGPEPRTVETMASELHALLAAADVQPPYVLGGLRWAA
jgi:pimeloyl-ACP methyl ester carboxylesterase